MPTFTVFCHGTGFNRVKGSECDELVAWCHNNIHGREAKLVNGAVVPGNYLINEGPGHGGNGLEQAQNVNPISGESRTRTPLKKLFSTPGFADHAAGNTHGRARFASTKGKISGEGWDENVVRTVNVIQEMQFTHGVAITRVNLVGWSRGAVTCIRIAHLLYEVFKTTIECNIFAVDPVAGADAGEKMRDTQVLNPNVRRYIGILSMHEMRQTFKPQDWSRIALQPHATTAVMLPMPGVHNAQVMVKIPADAAYITRNLAAAFLRANGSPLARKAFAHLNSPEDMCQAYGRLVLSLSEHRAYQSSGIASRLVGMGLRRRAFATHSKMDGYTRGGKGSYWINEHHRACFQAAFPAAYQNIFESNGRGQWPLADIDGRLQGALSRLTAIRDSLMAKELLAIDGTGPRPEYLIELGAGRYGDQVVSAWPGDFPLHA
ncbi:MAG: hypothetical protein KDG55_13935 [Rhodocyclaceae bacterium]|nr:hypothetical protein [Rhodocyclaceae bacterium]